MATNTTLTPARNGARALQYWLAAVINTGVDSTHTAGDGGTRSDLAGGSSNMGHVTKRMWVCSDTPAITATGQTARPMEVGDFVLEMNSSAGNPQLLNAFICTIAPTASTDATIQAVNVDNA